MTLWQDLRFSLRLLRKSPAFTAMAIVTLALTIGANATIFSLTEALFLRTLPVPDAHELVHVNQRRANQAGELPLSMPDYQHYRERSQSFVELAAHYPGAPMQVVVDGDPISLVGSVVTANYFPLLKVEPFAGRFFRPDEDVVRGRDAVAVISHGFLDRVFGGDRSAVGRLMEINGTQFQIVGVAPPELRGVVTRTAVVDVWIPSAMFTTGYRFCDAFTRGCNVVRLLGRLKPDVTRAASQAELDVLAAQLETAFPDTNRGRGVHVVAARGVIEARTDGQMVTLLSASVAVLLLIGCANLAGLLVARGLWRRKEITARLALGASRTRLLRQLLTESIFLSLIGGVLGIVVALWTRNVVQSFYLTDYSGNPINVDLAISPLVMTATLALSMLTGLIFGLVPALQAGRADVMMLVREENISGSLWKRRLQDSLVVVQVALSIVLLVGAGLVVRSLQHLYRGPGLDPAPVIVMRLRPSLVNYGADRSQTFQREAIRRLEAMPGVIAASPSRFMSVFPGWGDSIPVWRPDRAPAQPDDALEVLSNRVGPRFFETLGVAPREGREFLETDRPGAPEVVIINEALAALLWPGDSAVGRELIVEKRPHLVVGVVRDVRYQNQESGAAPFLFRSYWQQSPKDTFGHDSRTHVRVAGDPYVMMGAIRREMARLDPRVPLSEDYPLVDRISLEFQPVRVATTMFVSFGGLALFLSAIGLYGVLAITMQHRRRELAIRLALGAERGHVMQRVFGHGLRLAAAGAILGLGVSLLAAGALRSLLYGVQTYDVVTFVATPLVLAVVAVIASAAPAWRASRIDPVIALRGD